MIVWNLNDAMCKWTMVLGTYASDICHGSLLMIVECKWWHVQVDYGSRLSQYASDVRSLLDKTVER